MNRYNVQEQLGDGAFGVVYRAEQKATGEVVAIKRMKQRFVTWEECLQLREIISLRRLQHPNVIKMKEVVRENAELCMVFEFMEQNVYQIVKSRSQARGHSATLFDEREIRSILTQTLLGLQAIHRGGFMHRDLKPENLLTKGDIVKIADFGLAKEIRSRPPFTDYVSTRWYRAPEIVLRSDRYNSPIDIWALGVIGVELYLNRPLFPGGSDTDQLFKICSVLGAPTPQEWDEGHQLTRRLNLRFPSISPTPLRQLLAGTNASPQVLDLFEQMLRFNPADRPTASQCLMHPFITGGDSGMAGTANLYMGIASGQAHNPFHIAAGVPGGAGPNAGPAGLGGTYHGGGSSGSTTVGGGGNVGGGAASTYGGVAGPSGLRNSPSPGGSPTPGAGAGWQPTGAGAGRTQPAYGTGAGVPPFHHSSSVAAGGGGYSGGAPSSTTNQRSYGYTSNPPQAPGSPPFVQQYGGGAGLAGGSSMYGGGVGGSAYRPAPNSFMGHPHQQQQQPQYQQQSNPHQQHQAYQSSQQQPQQQQRWGGYQQQQSQQSQQPTSGFEPNHSRSHSGGLGTTYGSNAAPNPGATTHYSSQHQQHHFGSAGPLDEY